MAVLVIEPAKVRIVKFKCNIYFAFGKLYVTIGNVEVAYEEEHKDEDSPY